MASINYACLGQATAVAIPPPPLATDIATTFVRVTPTSEQYAAAITAAMPTSLAADSFRKQDKHSISDSKILQKIPQWTNWCQSTVTTGQDHRVAKVFDATYLPGDTAA